MRDRELRIGGIGLRRGSRVRRAGRLARALARGRRAGAREGRRQRAGKGGRVGGGGRRLPGGREGLGGGGGREEQRRAERRDRLDGAREEAVGAEVPARADTPRQSTRAAGAGALVGGTGPRVQVGEVERDLADRRAQQLLLRENCATRAPVSFNLQRIPAHNFCLVDSLNVTKELRFQYSFFKIGALWCNCKSQS